MVAMKIIVLNGSPKGDLSVTMQYVHFVQKKFLQHEKKILNISQRIQAIVKEGNVYREIIDEVSSANGVLWAFPLYSSWCPLITNDSSSSSGRDKFNDDAPESNTMDAKGNLYQAEENGDDQAIAKSAGERKKEIANDVSYIHRFFQKMRLYDLEVPNAFFIGTVSCSQCCLSFLREATQQDVSTEV